MLKIVALFPIVELIEFRGLFSCANLNHSCGVTIGDYDYSFDQDVGLGT